MDIDIHVGAEELQQSLFRICKEEWDKIYPRFPLVLDKLKLSTLQLIEIKPPEDGSDDVECLLRCKVLKAHATTGKPVIPKTLSLVFSMNSRNYAEFMAYCEEEDFNANLSLATQTPADKFENEVRDMLRVV